MVHMGQPQRCPCTTPGYQKLAVVKTADGRCSATAQVSFPDEVGCAASVPCCSWDGNLNPCRLSKVLTRRLMNVVYVSVCERLALNCLPRRLLQLVDCLEEPQELQQLSALRSLQSVHLMYFDICKAARAAPAWGHTSHLLGIRIDVEEDDELLPSEGEAAQCLEGLAAATSLTMLELLEFGIHELWDQQTGHYLTGGCLSDTVQHCMG